MTDTGTSLSARQKMLLALANDLAAQGWDQTSKAYSLSGEPNDEWLTLLGTFTGSPDTYLSALDDSADLSHGVLVVSEGWDYPKRIKDSLTTEARRAAYRRSVPPNKHPERTEIRQLLLVCKDGEVLALTTPRVDTEEPTWARMVDTSDRATGDRTIDLARTLLGLRPKRVRNAPDGETMRTIGNLADALQSALNGDLSEEEITRNLFLSMPDQMKAQLLKDMPPHVKQFVAASLTEEERRKYGL